MTWRLQELKKSRSDIWLGGVCGGFGEYTPLPSWMWRAATVVLTICAGVGLLIYIALWIFMPKAQ